MLISISSKCLESANLVAAQVGLIVVGA